MSTFLRTMFGAPADPRAGREPNAVDNRRMYVFLLIGTVASTAGLESWQALINNFAVEAAGLSGLQFGATQSVREFPGFLALLVIYLLYLIKEHRLAAASVLLMGVGVVMTGFLPSFAGLIVSTLVMSFGFHYYQTVNQSLTLQYFNLEYSPLVMGRLRSIASATSVLVSLVMFLLAAVLVYEEMFLLMGGLTILAGVWMMTQNPTDKGLAPQHRKMVLRKRYWLFYALTFLGGARRQVFTTFAVFMLVEKFGLDLRAVTGLFLVNHAINYFFAPLLGKAVNRFGERAILTVEYTALLFIFTAYALVEQPWIACALYVLDHVVFNFAIAIQTYFQKIADPKDIAPSMAVGFTINHIAAVVIPVTGGLLWMVDYRIPFLAGVVLAVMSLALSQCIPRHGFVDKRAGSS